MRFSPVFIALALSISLPLSSFAQELPIKPVRTISFTTDEGSSMNVDVSPDGKTLLFDLLGDLYTVPATGGKARQLTRGLALNLYPTWSPNGTKIVCNSDRSGAFHATITDSGRTFSRVLGISGHPLDFGFDALWSPDGNYIAIADSLYSVEGGKVNVKLPVKHPIHFSADGNLIFAVEKGRFYSYDQTSGSTTTLASVSRHSEYYVLSPDLRWFCYLVDSNDRKCLVAEDLTNHTSRIIIPNIIEKNPHVSPYMLARHFSISPDSKLLFIGYAGKLHRVELESGRDEVIPFSATVKVDMGAYDYNTFRVSDDSMKVKYMRYANVSPDGKRLTFAALNRIYIMDLPKGKPRILAKQSVNQSQPAFSPDGRWIAYVSWSDSSGGAVWRVPALGGTPEQLTDSSGLYEHPAWSPDGASLAFLKTKPNLPNIYDVSLGRLELLSLNGKALRIIDDSVNLSSPPFFSSNGDRIFYTPKYRGKDAIALTAQFVSKDLTDNKVQTIAVGASHTSFQEKSLSPDGRYLVYSVDEDLYLMPASRLTRPIPMFNWDNQQPSAIRFAAGVDPCWEQDGKVLAWTYGNQFYRIAPDKIMAAAVSDLEENGPDVAQNFITVYVKPDQIVDLLLTEPVKYARNSIALKNVRIITMLGNKVIENGTILIGNGRIIELDPSNIVKIPIGAKIVDLAGATIMPGLIDTHLHLHLRPDILPQQYWTLLVGLAYGITTARDPSSNFDSFGYAELLKTGQLIGPRLYTVGRPVRRWDGAIRLDNLQDALSVVQKRAIFGATIIKQYAQPNRLRRELLLLACRKFGLNMTNEGDPNPIMELAMIKDGSSGVEHNPTWDDPYNDYLTVYAASKIFFTPTLQVTYSRNFVHDNYTAEDFYDYNYWSQPNAKLSRFTPKDIVAEIESHPKDTTRPDFLYQAEFDARIFHAGGRICLGSHGNDEGIGAHTELWALQKGGLTNMEALRCATIMGAEAIGVQKDLGSLEVGKIADLIVLNKNPLDDIHNSREIRYVMKDGILYDGDTLDEIWPEQKKCPDWRLHASSK